jgi:hypothetical protein
MLNITYLNLNIYVFEVNTIDKTDKNLLISNFCIISIVFLSNISIYL